MTTVKITYFEFHRKTTIFFCFCDPTNDRPEVSMDMKREQKKKREKQQLCGPSILVYLLIFAK